MRLRRVRRSVRRAEAAGRTGPRRTPPFDRGARPTDDEQGLAERGRRLLARDVAAAKTLTLQYAEFGVGPAAVTVDFLEGLAPYLPRLVELCP